MRRIDIIKRAGRNLRQAKARTALTALAMSVGAFTIGLALMLGNGGRAFLTSVIDSAGSASTVYVAHARDEKKLPEYGKNKAVNESGTLVLSDDDVAKLSKLDHVKTVRPYANVTQVVRYVESPANHKRLIASINVKNEGKTSKIVAGELTKTDDGTDLVPGQAILAKEYLADFGFASAQDAIGKTVTLHAKGPGGTHDVQLTIVAVETAGMTSIGYQPGVTIATDDALLINQKTKAPGTPNQYPSAVIRADSDENAAAVKDAVVKLGGGDYQAQTFTEAKEGMLSLINGAQYALLAFGALALLASMFGIINTMYISVLERTQQIGLMKALGMRSRDVGKLFRYEAALIGVIGGAIGAGGASLLSLLNPWIVEKLKFEEGMQLLLPEAWQMVALVALLAILGIIASYLPSRKATKLDPIEALRTE